MAECLQHALLESQSRTGRVFAVCAERYIADELRAVRRNLAALLASFNLEHYVPLLESPILGVRVERLADKVARKGYSGRKR
jgi:hypothetical protein